MVNFMRRAAGPPSSRVTRIPGRKGTRTRLQGLTSMTWAGRKWLGFAAWFFVSGCVYWFFELASPATKFISSAFFTLVTPATDQPHAAWALSCHAAGLALFLVIYTRQSRWVIATAAGWLTILWGIGLVFPRDWQLLVAHAFGYAILLCCLVATLGVFGGVVLLWSELLSFVRLVCKYPQVKKDLSEHPLLEKVVVRGPRVMDLKDVAASISSCHSQGCTCTNCMHSANTTEKTHWSMGGSSPRGLQDSEDYSPRTSLDLAPGTLQGVCFLCKEAGVAVVPVCEEWTQPSKVAGASRTLSICRPFVTLKAEKSRLLVEVATLSARVEEESAARLKVEQELAQKGGQGWLNPLQGTRSPEAQQEPWQAILSRERAARQHAESEALKRGLEALQAWADAGAEAAAKSEMETRALQAEARALKAEAELQVKLDIIVNQLVGCSETMTPNTGLPSPEGGHVPSSTCSSLVNVSGEVQGTGKKVAVHDGKAKREIKRLLEEALQRELQLQACKEELGAVREELMQCRTGA